MPIRKMFPDPTDPEYVYVRVECAVCGRAAPPPNVPAAIGWVVSIRRGVTPKEATPDDMHFVCPDCFPLLEGWRR